MRSSRISEEDFERMQQRVRATKGPSGQQAPTRASKSSLAQTKLHRVCPPWFPYRSKLERAWANYLCGLELAGEIDGWQYEPFSMWLPGYVRFKPDFLVWKDRRLTIYEMKGYSRNRRDGLTRLKVAAGVFPCVTWVLVTREQGKWNETSIGE